MGMTGDETDSSESSSHYQQCGKRFCSPGSIYLYSCNGQTICGHEKLEILLFRSFHSFFNKLQNAENSRSIFNISGCLKPCHSKEYKQVGSFQSRFIYFPKQVLPLTKYSTYGDEVCFVSIWVASSDTSIQTEVKLNYF